MIKKFATHPVIYDGFEYQDLIGFTFSRGLDISEATGRYLAGSRARYAKAVERQTRRDAMATQPKAEDLTPPGLHAGSVITATDSGLLVRRSSRLVTQTPTGQGPSLRSPNRLVKPVRSPATKKVIFLSLHGAQKKLQQTFDAPRRLPKKSLIQILETADRELRFDFLGLPPELRDIVLHMVCVSSTTIIQPQGQPAIARTCQIMRKEALAVYYSCNRFNVFLDTGHRAAVSSGDPWLQSMLPCHLAYVCSLSFTHIGAVAFLDIDFDVRGQTLGVVRLNHHQPCRADRRRREYSNYSWGWSRLRDVPSLRSHAWWGSKLQNQFPYLQTSSSLLAAFESSVSKRTENVRKPSSGDTDAETVRIADWRRLEVEWTARKGFSRPSIERIMEMLIESKSDIMKLWVHDLMD
ncbi:hypothetical protein E4T39_02190 [Aureobasidium subglaciale]|nr:hypothetical protein E4T39_02190 [Aureobasidium subglaciale]